MYCKNCGKEIPDISYFCMFCGANIKSNENTIVSEYPITEHEKFYENIIKNKVIIKLKSPGSATWPRYEESMVKNITGFTNYTVIETYVDSYNAFGAVVRLGVRIKINDNFQYLGFVIKEWNALTYSMYMK